MHVCLTLQISQLPVTAQIDDDWFCLDVLQCNMLVEMYSNFSSSMLFIDVCVHAACIHSVSIACALPSLFLVVCIRTGRMQADTTCMQATISTTVVRVQCYQW